MSNPLMLLSRMDIHSEVKRAAAHFNMSVSELIYQALSEKLVKMSDLGEKHLIKIELLIEEAKAKAFEKERKDIYWENMDDQALRNKIVASFMWTQYFDWNKLSDNKNPDLSMDDMLEREAKII